jgi:Fe-S-cluster containining protein
VESDQRDRGVVHAWRHRNVGFSVVLAGAPRYIATRCHVCAVAASAVPNADLRAVTSGFRSSAAGSTLTPVSNLLESFSDLLDDPRATVSCTCRTCPSCCKIVRVPVTHRDLERLQRATLQPVEVHVEWLAPEQIDMTGEPESFVELDVGRRLLALRYEHGACHLLTSVGRCSQYLARPAACAAYPYALSDAARDGQPHGLFVLQDSPCGDAVIDGGPMARQAVLCVEAELNEYVGLVCQWNRQQRRRRLAGHRPRTAASFLEFLSGESEQ